MLLLRLQMQSLAVQIKSVLCCVMLNLWMQMAQVPGGQMTLADAFRCLDRNGGGDVSSNMAAFEDRIPLQTSRRPRSAESPRGCALLGSRALAKLLGKRKEKLQNRRCTATGW